MTVEGAAGGPHLVEPQREGGSPRHGQDARGGGHAPAGMGGHDEAGFAAARQGRGPTPEARMEQQPRGAVRPRREHQPPGRDEAVEPPAPELGENQDIGRPQRFLRRPEGRLRALRAHHDQPVGIEPVGFQARPVGHAALGGGAIIHDPDQRAAVPQAAGRDRQGEAGRRPLVPRLGRHDLVQDALPEAAIEQGVQLQARQAERHGAPAWSRVHGPRRRVPRTGRLATVLRGGGRPSVLDAGDGCTQKGDVFRSAARRHRLLSCLFSICSYRFRAAARESSERVRRGLRTSRSGCA